MRISPEGAKKFISLYTLLLYYAGQERKVLSPEMNLDEFKESPLILQARCREAIYEPRPLIERFLTTNVDLLAGEAQATLATWARSYVRGTFGVLRHLKKHTIFVAADGSMKVYGVLGLTDELSTVVPRQIMPALVKTVLLPYEGAIVCDGLVIAAGHVTLDEEMKREMTEQYKAIAHSSELITSLD